MRNFEYFEPKDVNEALGLLSRYGEKATFLAGGTNLIPRMKKGLISPSYVVSIGQIASLQKIEEEQEGLKIGAMVPLAVLERHPLITNRYPALHKASCWVGSPSLRNVATIGGNICLGTRCIYADQVQTWRRALAPCLKQGGKECYVVRGGNKCHSSLSSDTIPALVALEAKVVVLSTSGQRTISIQNLYTGDGLHPLNLEHGELLTQIILPSPRPSARSGYLRYSFRKAIDFPLISAGFYIEQKEGVCVDVRIVLGALAPGPIRLFQLEGILKGEMITPKLLRYCSEEAPKEALRSSRSGRISAFIRRMTTHLVYHGLVEVSEQR